jgi:UDP-N-acetylmuramoylalanine--D-glutamate ligase
MNDVRGKRVLMVGLARTGLAVARCFQRHGAIVTVTDSRPPWALQADVRELLAHRMGMELGTHRDETFLKQDLIVVSPGVLPDLPQLAAARARAIPVIPEVEAAAWFLAGTLIGITGSNGKTTTTALLGKMLETSGFRTLVGGNIGVPLISLVEESDSDSMVVAELSSFQLEGIRDLRPHVAVLLNITRNHLDRHPSFEAYVRAKAQIFRNQTPEDVAVLNADDPVVMSLAPEITSRKIFISRKRELAEGVFLADGQILYRVKNLERALLDTRDVPLQGEFNLENVLAACMAACALGADFGAIRKAVREFKAVEHRLEFVRELRGVKFYNDSKATSVDATAKALSAFENGIHLILGGKDKGAPYTPLRPCVKDRVRCIYLIGAAAERIAQDLHGAAELVQAGDLATAVRCAFGRARSGEVILLSPACASFDQFQDFEHRGRVFKQLVQELQLEEVARAEAAPAVEAAPLAAETEKSPLLVRLASEERPGVPPQAKGVLLHAEEAAPVPALEIAPAAESSPPVLLTGLAEAGNGSISEDAEIRHPELIYVYEVGAEERAPEEADITFADVEENSEVAIREESGPVEAVDDDLLPFEVRITPASHGGPTGAREDIRASKGAVDPPADAVSGESSSQRG